jgi:VIT1/CCC1 family predicted Fe2+/Mn2+ transporter
MKFEGLLDPVDRICEILFGLFMAVTIVGSLSVANAGTEDVRTVTAAAIGCNLAWGLVDAVMYVLRAATGRMHNRSLARRIADARGEEALELVAHALPAHIAAIAGPRELEGLRQRVLEWRGVTPPILNPRDFAEAFAVFAMVVVATFPVVIPFLVFDKVATAMYVSQAVTVAMLFLAGFALGRYGGHDRPLRFGALMAVIGVVVVAAVKALGG